jgi:hypothetical protein
MNTFKNTTKVEPWAKQNYPKVHFGYHETWNIRIWAPEFVNYFEKTPRYYLYSGIYPSLKIQRYSFISVTRSFPLLTLNWRVTKPVPSDRRELQPYNLPIAWILPHLKKIWFDRVVGNFNLNLLVVVKMCNLDEKWKILIVENALLWDMGNFQILMFLGYFGSATFSIWFSYHSLMILKLL